jgi:hypothetical protein
MDKYYLKYLKYKQKYLDFKIKGGTADANAEQADDDDDEVEASEPTPLTRSDAIRIPDKKNEITKVSDATLNQPSTSSKKYKKSIYNIDYNAQPKNTKRYF